jgi:hypothetical protein
MKKINFLKISLVALIIGSIFFLSCNNEDENSNQSSQKPIRSESRTQFSKVDTTSIIIQNNNTNAIDTTSVLLQENNVNLDTK